MQSKVRVININKFVSKKGNPCMFVFVQEDSSGFPFRILVFDKDQVNKPLAVGDQVTLYTDIDSNLFGVLRLKW